MPTCFSSPINRIDLHRLRLCTTSLLFFALVGFLNHLQAAPFAKQKFIEADEINSQLRQAFPIDKVYQSVSARFYQPEIVIDSTDDTVEIDVLIRSEQDGRLLQAKGVLKGRLEFYGFTNSVRLKKPVLDDFGVIKDELEDSSDVRKAIQQSMSRTFRDLVLFEVDSLGLEFPDDPPDQILISINKLILSWE